MGSKCIDRKEELNQVKQIVVGGSNARVLLIQAGSGWGKSELLREYRRSLPSSQPVAIIEFKHAGKDLQHILFHICEIIGWEKFPNFSKESEKYSTVPNINVAHLMMLGSNELKAEIKGIDKTGQSLRRQVLTKAFLKDLRKAGQVIIVIDVFEKCDEEIRNWLIHSFLPTLKTLNNVSVIIAGVQVPEPTLEWEAEKLILGGIALKHWTEYLKTEAIDISDEDLKLMWQSCDGQPLRMLELITVASAV